MTRATIVAFTLVAFAMCADFLNGFLCARIAWLLVAPVELLYIPAFALLVVVGLVSIGNAIWARTKHGPVRAPAWRLQLLTWSLLGLLYYTSFDPRLSGLAIRARMQEATLIDFCSRYRAGGDRAVIDHAVMQWGIGQSPRVRATDRFVEISWGATLPRTWGIRVSDEERPVPQFAPGIDDAAMAATDRLTVFIGIY